MSTDEQRSTHHQPIEKQVEEAMVCNCGVIEPGTHQGGCPANHRPAVLALLERQHNQHEAQITSLTTSFENMIEADKKLLERREQEHAAEVKGLRTLLRDVWDDYGRRGDISTNTLIKLEATQQPELGPCGRQHPKSCWVDKCPTCEAPARHLHPAMQHEGEVQVCTDQWHESKADTFCTACAQEKAAPGGVSNVEP